MGQASSTCTTQKQKLERVVNICCREDKDEFSVARYNVYQNERNRHLLDADRKGSRTVSTSKWKSQQQSDSCNHYEICCGCEMEESGHESLFAAVDHESNNSSRKGVPSADKKKSTTKHESQTECSENHHRMPPPPPSWTEPEMILLKRAVEKAARTQRIKPPGFAAMQAIHAQPHPPSCFQPTFICLATSFCLAHQLVLAFFTFNRRPAETTAARPAPPHLPLNRAHHLRRRCDSAAGAPARPSPCGHRAPAARGGGGRGLRHQVLARGRGRRARPHRGGMPRDGYMASHYASVARFSSSGRRIDGSGRTD